MGDRDNLQRREKYASDPDYRATVLKRNSEYRKALGPEYLAKKKRYYEANRMEILARKRSYAATKEFPPGWDFALKRLYGITGDEYIEMHRKQKGLCAICQKPETAKTKNRIRLLSVDHDKKTGRVRQLLCTNHNTMLGLGKESIVLFLRAISYLLRHRLRGIV